MKSIYISNDVMCNKDIGTYSAISYLSNSSCENVIFNVKQIGYVLYGKFNLGRYTLDSIKKSLSNLIEEELIIVVDEYSGEYVIENTFNIDGSVGKFTIITLDELRSIHGIDTNNINMIFKYFICLISTINTDKKCGWYTIDGLSDLTNMSKDTIMDYNKLLEDNKLIYVHRANATYKVDNMPRQVNNTYGRYADKKQIVASANEYISTIQAIESSNIDINSRSISKKYNDFVSGKYKGNPNELKQLCLQYNKKYKFVADVKLKDMSVFEAI